MKIPIEDSVSTPVTGERIAMHFPRSFAQREGLTICRVSIGPGPESIPRY